jgi:hypothetical protein
MKLRNFLRELNDRPPQTIPDFIIWMPPDGAVIECAAGTDTVELAELVENIAGKFPGRAVAAFSLVGHAMSPGRDAKFIFSGGEDADASARGMAETQPLLQGGGEPTRGDEPRNPDGGRSMDGLPDEP